MIRGGAGKRKGRRGFRRRFGSASPAGRAWAKARRREGWWTHKTPDQIMADVFDMVKALSE